LASFGLFLFLSASLVYAWTAPTATPPGSNSAGPLNISDASQIKNGTLGIGGLLVNGSSSLQDKIQIAGGNPGVNKVLVSDAAGNARWMDYLLARKNADRFRCPNGSSRISLNGKTFCGYIKTTSGQCDAFGKTYDSMVACYDKGIGRNHGITPTATGCYGWEGRHNNGGPGVKFYCEKLAYNPHSPSDCTDSRAVKGTLSDTSLSPTTINTCNIPTPYTYQGCTTGTQVGNGCLKTEAQNMWGGFGGWGISGFDTIHATSTSCMPGWSKYINDCI
jgi:hypothetical protein